MNKRVEIYVNDRYYGAIRMKFPPKPFVLDEEEITEEIVRRMPSLKKTKFTIAF